MQQSVVLPPGILSTSHGIRRRPCSLEIRRFEHGTTDFQTYGRSNGLPGTTYLAQPQTIPDHGPPTINARFAEPPTYSEKGTQGTPATQNPPETAGELIASTVVDFGQPLGAEENYGGGTSKPATTGTVSSVSEEEEIVDELHPHRSSGILNRLSFVARDITRRNTNRTSSSSDENTSCNSISSVPMAQMPESDAVDLSSRIAQRLSYVAQGLEGYRASVISSARSFRQSIFRPSQESHDMEGYHEPKWSSKRNSKAIPKSWRFLGIDGHGIGSTVHDVTQSSRSNIHEMYEKAKIRQQQIKRSRMAQLVFRYTFYVLLVATVYLVLVGLPLWRGAVWYLYILFQKYMVLKAGLAITFGTSFLSVKVSRLSNTHTPLG